MHCHFDDWSYEVSRVVIFMFFSLFCGPFSSVLLTCSCTARKLIWACFYTCLMTRVDCSHGVFCLMFSCAYTIFYFATWAISAHYKCVCLVIDQCFFFVAVFFLPINIWMFVYNLCLDWHSFVKGSTHVCILYVALLE